MSGYFMLLNFISGEDRSWWVGLCHFSSGHFRSCFVR